jgi:PAS domain S-box-containing protein
MAGVTHEQVLNAAMEHLKDVFDASPDGVYVWVDDAHKECNERLAAMFGRTVEEWRATEDFLGSFVAEEDRQTYGRNFGEHVASLTRPVRFRFRGLRKDGSSFAAETDMVPLSIHGHAVAYHFVRELDDA